MRAVRRPVSSGAKPSRTAAETSGTSAPSMSGHSDHRRVGARQACYDFGQRRDAHDFVERQRVLLLANSESEKNELVSRCFLGRRQFRKT